jgi:hypothetical protein
MGISVSRSLFPVQALALDPHFGTVRLHRTLREAGVQTLLARNPKTSDAELLFVFNASHSISDIDRAIMLLDAAIRYQSRSFAGRSDGTMSRVSRRTCNRSLTLESL